MNVTAIVIGVVIVAVVVLGVWYFVQQQRRRRELREQFGPEYDRAVDTYGEHGKAERVLEARAERVAALHIQPLSPDDSQRYAERWRQVQARFVDDPEGAIGDADELCAEVMQVRGYPMGDFEQRAADISVDHPHVVEHYRAAHAVATDPDAGTEHLRQAMVHYRTLFEDLIEGREAVRR
jgi:hypothetical protein